MSHPRPGVASTARSLVAVARAEQLGFMAAAIAYYTFVSLIPLLLVTVAVASAVAGPALAADVLAVAGGVLSPEAVALLRDSLTSGAGRGGATAAGLVVLLWSGLRVFRGLDVAFARIYRVDAHRSFVTNVRDAAVAFAAIALAVGAVVAVTALLPLVGFSPGGPLRTLWLAVALPVVFLPLYYVFPDCRVTVREVIPGAALAGLGWTLLGFLFGVYAATADSFQLYGLIGGVLLVLTWFYLGGLVLLSGATLNTVLAGRRDRQVQQGSLRGPTRVRMSESDGPEDDADDVDADTGTETGTAAAETGPDRVSERVDYEDIAELRRELDRFESEIDDRTVHRDELEADLKGYIRRRQRRGHARGWGPYLVLLYGTLMTLGAFYFLTGVWAVLAMVIIWLSTLGLYTLMVLVGVTFTAAGLPGRLRDAVRDFRD
ncbi:MAG: YihY/virulence factor BrkB family protein [Haloarculaceae archaeon]